MGPSTVRYIPCPACGVLMNRKNLGRVSGVVVDICKQHGTWFDLGELPRVLAFAEAGGLARARALEMKERFEEKERMQSALATLRRPEPATSTSSSSYDGGAEVGVFSLLLHLAALPVDS